MYFSCKLRFFFIVSLSTLLTACMVGPNFHPPASPSVHSFTEKPLPAKTASTKNLGSAGKAQEYISNQNIPAEWWYLFHSPTINSLVNTGLANNPGLGAAYAALRVAEQNFNAGVGNLLFPAFNAQLGGQRQLFSAASIGSTNTTTGSTLFNLFNAGVNVTYTLDLFGGSRRQIEALGAQVDYQQFQLIAAYLTLTSNIVTTAVTIAALEAEIEATRSLLHDEEEVLYILKQQYRLGGISEQNLLQQETLASQTAATIPPFEKSLSQNKHALAALIGTFPDQPLPKMKLNAIHLPHFLPVSVPSNLVRQRPDVRASEALVHAASAQIGVATANMLPQFAITGNYGWEAITPSTLFGTSTNVWSIAGQFTQPVFHGGALLAQRRGAIAAYDQAFDQYKQTALQAFQNVADSLRALETDARTLKYQRAAEVAAEKALHLTQAQYRLGGVNYLALLIVQQQYHQTLVARIQAQATRYTDTVALYQSLGGGWWNNEWCTKQCLFEK